jgi:preprotein translocase subunit SecA
MDNMGVQDDTPIDAKVLSNAIENAQKKVESRNFQARKDVLDYDDVMNTQREVIYEQRRKVLAGDDLKDSIATMIRSMISRSVKGLLGEQKHLTAEQWKEATVDYRGVFLLPDELVYTDEQLSGYSADQLIEQLEERAFDIYEKKEQILGEPLMRELERVVMLRVVDEYWMDNIDAMDELKQGIRLRAYGQEDPVVAYKREGYEMFETMITAIQEETVRRIYLTRVKERVERKAVAKVTGESGGSDGTVKKQPVRKTLKIGRNDPCPCGSGLKWKKCTCAAYHSDQTTQG